MNDVIKISVVDLIGCKYCISGDDGQKVFEKISEYLNEGKKISVSFDGCILIISDFLNVAFGQLYGSFAHDKIRLLMRVEGLSGDDLYHLKRVVDNAKRFYAYPLGYEF